MGFLDRFKPGEKSRDEDQAVREYLSRKLDDATARLRALVADAGRGKTSLDRIGVLGELNRRHDVLDRLTSELRHASYGEWGYRGGPDKHQKRAEDARRLALVTEFDESLDQNVDQLVGAIEALTTALAAPEGAPLKSGLDRLDGLLAQLEKRLRQRQEMLKNPDRVDWPESTPATPPAAAPPTGAPSTPTAPHGGQRNE